jgi:ATP-dependent DNA helicase RecG
MVYLACAARRGTPARSRIDALEATSDGFELAELDLRLRHEGELLGYRQHGGAVLHLVDLAHDARLIEAAHAEAEELIAADPMLQDGLHRALALEVRERFGVYFEEVGRT